MNIQLKCKMSRKIWPSLCVVCFVLTYISYIIYTDEVITRENIDMPGKINTSVISKLTYIISTKTTKTENIYMSGKMNKYVTLKVTDKETISLKSPKRGEENIFFMETTCFLRNISKTSEILLSAQSACAIESAALTHPNSSIYIFYTCPVAPDSLQRSTPLVQEVLRFPNVHIWKESLPGVFSGTPLQKLFGSKKIHRSKWPETHLSDVVRILALWKYGGTYLDLDFIVMRSLGDLGRNWACTESNDTINNAALSMASTGVGKMVADMCVEDLRTRYRGGVWAHNGPLLVTRVAAAICGYDNISTMVAKNNDSNNCHGFRVLQTNTCYPIGFNEWKKLFQEKNSDENMKLIEDGHIVHLSNSFQRSDKVTRYRAGSRQPVVRLRQMFCPRVHRSVK